MTVHVYNTPSAPDELYKDISTVISPALTGWTGEVRGDISLDNPSVLVNATVTVGNYAQIPDFARYYYIRTKQIISEGLTLLVLESDPLMSAAGTILTLPIVADRTATTPVNEGDPGWNAYLSDTQQPVLVPTLEDFYLLHTFDPDSGSYILVTIG